MTGLTGVVVLLDWRRGAGLAENRRLFARAAAAGRVRPRGWRARGARWRSLAVRADGALELEGFAVGTLARRLGAPAAGERGKVGGRG